MSQPAGVLIVLELAPPFRWKLTLAASQLTVAKLMLHTPRGQRDLRVDRHAMGLEQELALAATRRVVWGDADRPAVAGRVAVLKKGLRQALRKA